MEGKAYPLTTIGFAVWFFLFGTSFNGGSFLIILEGNNLSYHLIAQAF